MTLQLHTCPLVIYKLRRFIMMLINCDMKALTHIVSQLQGAAGMLGSADLVKLCSLKIMTEICFVAQHTLKHFLTYFII